MRQTFEGARVERTGRLHDQANDLIAVELAAARRQRRSALGTGWPWVVVVSALLVGGCAGVTMTSVGARLGDHHGAVERGETVAKFECSGCHAVEARGKSPRMDAPPFSEVARRYQALRLDWELETISQVGHYAMPRKPLTKAQIRELDAYVRSLAPDPVRPAP